MLIAVLIAVLVLIVCAVPFAALSFNRAAARLAERKAAEYLAAPLGAAGEPAIVRVRARRFVTQALRGCYREVEVIGAVRVGDIGSASFVAHLTNARLPLRALLGGGARELPCDHVSGRLVLPYDGLARATRMPGLVLAFDGGRLTAHAALPMSVPGFEQFTRVSGEAVLTLREGGVWLRIKNVSVAGVVVPAFALRQLVPALTMPIGLPALPYGLRLDELTPSAAGLVVDCSASAVVFRAPPVPTPVVLR
ncbi:DUF2993 domain-containing protein [uncultured Jatrophihabitans sp.]|uniref:LmeA family phospholipid-binding protein n=1 Tax=uncultured Jatrophihabitans sp. TaxID=1610747 RepID=UPI0035CC4105